MTDKIWIWNQFQDTVGVARCQSFFTPHKKTTLLLLFYKAVVIPKSQAFWSWSALFSSWIRNHIQFYPRILCQVLKIAPKMIKKSLANRFIFNFWWKRELYLPGSGWSGRVGSWAPSLIFSKWLLSIKNRWTLIGISPTVGVVGPLSEQGSALQ